MTDNEKQLFAEDLLKSLFAKFPMAKSPRIVWKSLRVSAGLARFTTQEIVLSRQILTTEQQVADTLVHEYAHLLSFDRYGRKGAGHGPLWRKTMLELGAKPEVFHKYECQRNQKRQQVEYKCQKCGFAYVRHRRLPKNRIYLHRNCGGKLKLLSVASIKAENDSK